MRLPDSELHSYEDAIAVSLRIQQRVRRLVYMSDDPDILADLVGIAEDSARIRQIVIAEVDRRRLERATGLGRPV